MGKGEHFCTVAGIQIDATTVESSMEIPQKLKTELPYGPAILLLGIYLEKTLTLF